LAGVVVHTAGLAGLPGYPTMFVSVAAAFAVVAVVYALTASRQRLPRRTVRPVAVVRLVESAGENEVVGCRP